MANTLADTLYNTFSFGGPYFALFIISMIPLVELRGAVILGAAMQLDWQLVLLISLLGNIIPVPFVLSFGKRLIHWLKTIPLFSGLAHRYEAKLLSNADKINTYSLLGLCLFVAIPLPGTGAWSGSALAALLALRIRYAFPAITLGVLIAGIIMTLGAYGFVNFLQIMI